MGYNNKALIDNMKKRYCWYKTPELKDIIQAMSKLDYFIPSEREKLKEMFDQIDTGYRYEPFNSGNRFPRQQSWVYIGAPEYIEVLHELKRLLSQNDSMPSTPVPSNHMNIIHLKLNGSDETLEFNRQLTRLKILVASNVKVYERNTFEETFNLRWR
ncbi:hypothetical protein BD560DRAFT_407788 [Blakeslea trispora]|nr:hypothetical protein BD560DRAFT_407788 [Blakeslea trispora]